MLQVREIALDPFKVGQDQTRVVGILSPQFLILAMYLIIRRTKENHVLMGISLVV